MDTMTRGRKASGLKRPYIVQVAMNEEEFEYISRQSIDSGVSSSAIGRTVMLPPDWRKRLEKLRKSQDNKSLAELDGRRKNV